MNIFFLDWNPKLAAQYACDKHVVKMILESTQLLYTTYRTKDPDVLIDCPYEAYKITHKNHPCNVWLRESIENFKWLLLLALEYCEEYNHRYSSETSPKEHTCQKHLVWMASNLPLLPNIKMTTPAQAMPDKYKCGDVVEAYRKYYIGEKLGFVKYTNREIPEWLKSYL
jgi:hypothetical protein